VGKVLADLVTIQMIRFFRLRPLLLLGGAALIALAAGAAFALAALAPMVSGPSHHASVIHTGAALIWVACSVFLLMTGLIAEIAVQQSQLEGRRPTPLALEIAP
jgi:cyanate permease